MNFYRNTHVNLDCVYYISNFLTIKDKIKLALSCKDYFDILKLRIEKDIRVLNIIVKWYDFVYEYKNIRRKDLYTLLNNLNKNYDTTELHNKLIDYNNYNIELSKYLDTQKLYVYYCPTIFLTDNKYKIIRCGDIFYSIFINADNLQYIKINTFDKLFCLLFFNNENIKQKILLPIPIIMINNFIKGRNLFITFNKNAKINELSVGMMLLKENFRDNLITYDP